MNLSKRSIEMLLDLVEIKLSYMDISDREDARDMQVLERCRSELQSLAVERDNHTLGFAPAPECQERQWRWKQFFERLFGGGNKANS